MRLAFSVTSLPHRTTRSWPSLGAQVQASPTSSDGCQCAPPQATCDGSYSFPALEPAYTRCYGEYWREWKGSVSTSIGDASVTPAPQCPFLKHGSAYSTILRSPRGRANRLLGRHSPRESGISLQN